MNRRKFFKVATPLAATPLVIGGTSIRAFANQNLLQNTIDCEDVAGRILVILHLKGGNDGLNTLIPTEQYDTYVNQRPTLALPDYGINPYIELDSSLPLEQQVGLHPGMSAFKSLYDEGKVGIIQNVGYEMPNLSHFKSSELWLAGGDGTPENFNIQTGWMGRYLNRSYQGYIGSPTMAMPDPPGMQLGDSKRSIGFMSESEFSVSINLTGQDPSGFYNQVTEIGTAKLNEVPMSQYGSELQYAMAVQDSVSLYAQRISQVFSQGTNSHNNYSPISELAAQLKTVARLISGGCKTKVYLLNLSGFDTHALQSESDDPTAGRHAVLIKDMADSMKAFQDDLAGLGLDQKVLTVTFSEFGRKATENNALGTDHGTVAPMFVFGTAVKPGMLGINPNLANVTNDGQYQSELEYDYRQVYATLLQDWLGASDTVIEETQFNPYIDNKLPIIDQAAIADPGCYLTNILPITLTYFNAEAVDEKVRLKWQTATEINNAYFVIERSKDGVNFEDLFEVNGGGNSNIPLNYTAWDEEPLPGTSYYRLKQVDYDGRETKHNIEVVSFGDDPGFTVEMFPNPANRYINVAVNSTVGDAEGRISIFNMNGQQVKSVNINVYQGYSRIPVNVSDLANGQYAIQLRMNNGYFHTSKHIVNR